MHNPLHLGKLGRTALGLIGKFPAQEVDLAPLEGSRAPVRTLWLSGLDARTGAQLLVSGGYDGTIWLWQRQPHEPMRALRTLPGHTHVVGDLAFDPEGARFASVSLDRTVKLWDLATGTCLRTFTDHSGYVLRVVWCAHWRIIASCSTDRTLRLWDSSVHTLRRDRPYERMVMDFSDAQRESPLAFGAVER